MDSEEIVVRAVAALEDSGVDYMLVGSFATNVYGLNRNTMDVDFVVQLGDEFQLDRQFSFESITAMKRRIAHVADSSFRIEYFYLSDAPHDAERFRRRRRAFVPDLEREVNLLAKEDVIVTKLRWALDGGRNKDRDDLVGVLSVQMGNVDWDYVHRWAEEHGTRTLLDEIRANLPEFD